MTLYLIGLGLSTEKDITLRGLELVRKCDKIYLEDYTSLLQCPTSRLEELYGKKIIPAGRELVELHGEEIVKQAGKKEVALLVIGDPFSATTHIELFRLAKERKVPVQVVHNASVTTAVGITGLQLYKFGRTTSIPFPEEVPHLEAPYKILQQNLYLDMHTLFLLDLKPGGAEKEARGKGAQGKSSKQGYGLVKGNRLKDVSEPLPGKFMTVAEALRILKGIEKSKGEKVITPEMLVVGCARLGSGDFQVKAGQLREIENFDFGNPPHCLIIPARKLHFMEKEMLELWKGHKQDG